MTYHQLMLGAQSMFQNMVMNRAREIGLLPGQSKILDYLGEHDGSSLTEIAEGCYLSNATISGIIDRMEKNSLIARRQKDGNRRTHYIYLTEKGASALREITAVFEEIEEAAWHGIDPQDREQYMATLIKINKNLEAKKNETKKISE